MAAAKGKPKARQWVVARVDSDLVEWLKSHGKGYSTRINAILRAVMLAQAT